MILGDGHPCQAITAQHWDSVDEVAWSSRCLRTDDIKPMCFRGEPWCSDNHRKQVEAQRRAS